MSPENRQKMEVAQKKPQSFVLMLNLDEISPDGTARANASLVNSAAANAPASLRDASSNFIATLAADGEITAQYDPNMQPKTGAGGVLLNLKEVNLNNVGGQVMTQTISGSGNCDPATGLLLDYHEEIGNLMTNGSRSSIKRDLKLRQ